MPKLLREHEVGPKFREIKKGVPEVCIAVPFWGKGAIRLLGFNQRQKARVICNLSSTACNPYVIEALKKIHGVTVRSHPRLHAKIYAGPNFSIIGSSNASTNGLTEEGTAAEGWIEANILSDDHSLVRDSLKLFESIWKSRETVIIKPGALKKAKDAYDNRPQKNNAANASTLLAACRENPSIARSVFVAAYDQHLEPNGREMLASVKKGAVKVKSDLTAANFRNAWGYQFGQTSPKGSWLIDLNCIKAGKERVNGCAEVTGLVMGVDDEEDLMIALRGVVRSPINGRRLPISSKEKQLLVNNAQRILKRNPGSFVPLSKVLQMIEG